MRQGLLAPDNASSTAVAQLRLGTAHGAPRWRDRRHCVFVSALSLATVPVSQVTRRPDTG